MALSEVESISNNKNVFVTISTLEFYLKSEAVLLKYAASWDWFY